MKLKDLLSTGRWKELGYAIWQRPEQADQCLEEQIPTVSRHFLNYASIVIDPVLAGSGVHITELSDDSVQLSLPLRWKNQNAKGELSAGLPSALAELAVHLFCRRHMDLAEATYHMRNMELRFFEPLREDVKAQLAFPPHETERILFEMRREGFTQPLLPISFLNSKGRQLAQADCTVQLRSNKALPSGGGSH